VTLGELFGLSGFSFSSLLRRKNNSYFIRVTKDVKVRRPLGAEPSNWHRGRYSGAQTVNCRIMEL
jgi:hypothetical protein